MLKNAYLLAKIGADTAENDQNVAKMLINKIEITLPYLRANNYHAEERVAVRPHRLSAVRLFRGAEVQV